MISEKESREEFEKWLNQTCTVKSKIDLAWEAWQGALNPKFNKHYHPPKTLQEELLNFAAGKACRDTFFPDEDQRLSCALREALKIYTPAFEGKGWRLLKTVAQEVGRPISMARNAAILLHNHGYLINKSVNLGNTKVWKWRNGDAE